MQADGKIVVVGTSENLEGGIGWFTVVRYNPNGSLDATFDGDGMVTTPQGGGAAYDVAQQSDGRLVAVGASGNFTLARYNTNGSLDTGFSGDGLVTTGFGGIEWARSVALQADGRIVAGGGGPGDDFALARYEGVAESRPRPAWTCPSPSPVRHRQHR
ncbi:delta-60 repeat domain-containing protein [Streptomyces sp. NPDC005408]|uniref:delta-60 repeat domain-containing protein n=1 Tax=Streptomyces sp. NPDC005408 TaxID=3155341 RepID=UPI0033A2A775